MSTLSAAGDRLVPIDAEKAQEYLEAWQKQIDAGETITKVDLSCRVVTPAAMELWALFFETHARDSVEILKLDDIIAQLMTEDGLRTIELLSNAFTGAPELRELYLHHNALGTRAVDLLQGMLKSPKVELLDFSNCGMSVEVVQTLLDIFEQSWQRLRVLRMGRNQMGSQGAALLGSKLPLMTSLREFSYPGSRPLKDGTAALVEGLREQVLEHGVQLTVLDLDDCDLGTGEEDEDAVHVLAKVLEGSQSLKTLIVNGCGLEANGVEIVLEAVQNSEMKLETLGLEGNDMEAEGMEPLKSLLDTDAAKTHLQVLNLAGNLLDNDCVGMLEDFLQSNLSLRKLDLSDNEEITDITVFTHKKIETLEALTFKQCEDIEAGREEVCQMYPFVVIGDEEVAEQPAGDTDDIGDLLDAAKNLQLA